MSVLMLPVAQLGRAPGLYPGDGGSNPSGSLPPGDVGLADFSESASPSPASQGAHNHKRRMSAW